MPASPSTGNDRTTLWGVLGIIFAFCCGILGLIFGILSITSARNNSKPPTLGVIAIVISALNIIGGIVYSATGNLPH
jgi:Na+/proline symporter